MPPIRNDCHFSRKSGFGGVGDALVNDEGIPLRNLQNLFSCSRKRLLTRNNVVKDRASGRSIYFYYTI